MFMIIDTKRATKRDKKLVEMTAEQKLCDTTICFRINSKELEILKQKAIADKRTISNYIKSKLL
jgi:hypothetical protein